MSLCYLLRMDPPPMQEETFGFEHLQAHRQLWGSMAPLNRFSVLPYSLYPDATNLPAWHMDHEQAHRDAQDTLAAVFPGGIGFLNVLFYELLHSLFPELFPNPVNTTEPTQLAPGFNIQDYNLNNWAELQWWTFQNYYFHLIMESNQNSAIFVYPFF